MLRSHPLVWAGCILLVTACCAYYATARRAHVAATNPSHLNAAPDAQTVLRSNGATKEADIDAQLKEKTHSEKPIEPIVEPMSLGFEDDLKNWLQPTARWNYACACEEIPDWGKAATISDLPDAKEFGNLMQRLDARPYQGKWVRFSGDIKRAVTVGWAGFWMRLDGTHQEVLGFDNMQDRRLTGTRDFERHSVELFVPPETAVLSVGAILVGKGKIWVGHLKVETLDRPRPPKYDASKQGAKETQDF
ncbi:MAG: hypothetical protein HY291_23260 [Planctomycetes bacterium]|nr:hypothetical protein [Planctomycetota bacterium]